MLKIKSSVLKETLNQLAVVFKPTTVVPQDSYCMFESLPDNTLKVRFANTDSEIITFVKDVEITQPFKCLVHYNKLRATTAVMTNDITFKFSDKTVTVSGDKKISKISIPDMQKMSYYEEYKMQGGVSFTMSGEEFTTGLNAVKDSVKKNKNVYTYLQGVLFDMSTGKLILSAVTSKLCAMYETAVKASWNKDVIVPIDIIQSISRWKDVENVQISVNDSKIIFDTKTLRLSTVLLDGKFPNYLKLFEEKNEQTATINKDDLLSALKFATSVGAVDRTPVIDVLLVEEDGVLKLKTNSIYNDTTETEIEADNCVGLKGVFTGQDIQELVSGCEGSVYFNYTPNKTDGRFFINSDDPNYHAVIVGLQFKNVQC